MKKFSLRLRLIVYFIGISCIIWLAAGILSWHETKEKVDEFFDTYQMVLARQLSSADWSRITSESQKITDRLIKNVHNADDDDESIGFAVFNQSGKLIFHDNEDGKHFRFLPEEGNFVRQFIDGDDEWRIVWLKSADGKFLIAVGQEKEYRDDVVWDMLEEFMVPWGAGLFVLMVMIVAILTREFHPLGKLAEDLKERKSNDLSPLETTGIPSEVVPLIKAVNGQMQRIEAMLESERRFIADAAHELRTPLTALKIQLELAQMAEDDAPMRCEALRKLQTGIERSTRLVEQLLALSRIESSFTAVDMTDEKLDWPKLADSVVEEYLPEAAAKNITIEYKVMSSVPLERGNPTLWALLLRNLTDNAVKYSSEGEIVRIVIDSKAIEVINSGIKVDETVLGKLGERFFRPAGQRQKGSGLGLSIVKCIADYYGFRLEFANLDEGFSVKVISDLI